MASFMLRALMSGGGPRAPDICTPANVTYTHRVDDPENYNCASARLASGKGAVAAWVQDGPSVV